MSELRNKLRGKAKCLGWGYVDGAYGPVISITRCLLDGCKLVMQTDAGVWYAVNDDIKNAAENYGIGLRLTEKRVAENDIVEAVFEPEPEAEQKFVFVNGIRRLPPANAYVLATDFAGEFSLLLYREDARGERILLWGDDYIYK